MIFPNTMNIPVITLMRSMYSLSYKLSTVQFSNRVLLIGSVAMLLDMQKVVALSNAKK